MIVLAMMKVAIQEYDHVGGGDDVSADDGEDGVDDDGDSHCVIRVGDGYDDGDDAFLPPTRMTRE